MPDPFARPVPRVDEQLTTLVALQRDTAQQLAAVRAAILDAIADNRRRVQELQTHELNLLSAYAGREHRIDSLLDERLLSASADHIVTA